MRLCIQNNCISNQSLTNNLYYSFNLYLLKASLF